MQRLLAITFLFAYSISKPIPFDSSRPYLIAELTEAPISNGTRIGPLMARPAQANEEKPGTGRLQKRQAGTTDWFNLHHTPPTFQYFSKGPKPMSRKTIVIIVLSCFLSVALLATIFLIYTRMRKQKDKFVLAISKWKKTKRKGKAKEADKHLADISGLTNISLLPKTEQPAPKKDRSKASKKSQVKSKKAEVKSKKAEVKSKKSASGKKQSKKGTCAIPSKKSKSKSKTKSKK